MGRRGPKLDEFLSVKYNNNNSNNDLQLLLNEIFSKIKNGNTYNQKLVSNNTKASYFVPELKLQLPLMPILDVSEYIGNFKNADIGGIAKSTATAQSNASDFHQHQKREILTSAEIKNQLTRNSNKGPAFAT
jgi:hypothetical protein